MTGSAAPPVTGLAAAGGIALDREQALAMVSLGPGSLVASTSPGGSAPGTACGADPCQGFAFRGRPPFLEAAVRDDAAGLAAPCRAVLLPGAAAFFPAAWREGVD